VAVAEDRDTQVEHVASLERGLEVIKHLCSARRVTLAEIARDTDLSRAAARRFLLSLQHLGYVECDGRYYQLRRQIIDLGHAYLSSLPWWREAERAVERLSRQLAADCGAYVLDRGRVATVASSTHERFSVFEREVGQGEPAYASAAGRVLLAGLSREESGVYLSSASLHPLTPFTLYEPVQLETAMERIRAEGHAIAAQELQIGITSIAVPIRDRSAAVVAALGVQIASARDDATACLEALSAASAAITSAAHHD
jgi:IclR family pca regulon transcriptional regulator